MGNKESSAQSVVEVQTTSPLDESSQPNITEVEDISPEAHSVFRVKEDLPKPLETEIVEKKQDEISTTDKLFNMVGKAIDFTVRGSLNLLATSPIFKKETKELIGELLTLLEEYCSDLTVPELFVGYNLIILLYS